MGWRDDPVAAPSWENDPEAPPSVPLPDGVVAVPPHNDPVQDTMVDRSPIGRVLDTFGQGLKDRFGDAPVGLSQDTEKYLRDVGIFNDYSTGRSNIVKSFNEVLMRPAAAALDFVLRGSGALPGAAGSAFGQVLNETGVTQLVGATESQAVRDWGMLGDLAPYALGVAGELGVVRTPAGRAYKPASQTLGTVETATPPVPTPRPKVMAADEGLSQPSARFAAPESPVLDKAGNINLSRIGAPEDVKDVIRQVAEENQNFVEARRGVMSLAETEQLAEAVGLSPEYLMKRKVGEAFNAEQAVAARQALVQSATEVRDLAARAAGGAEADLLKFQEVMTRHVAIQEQVAGMTAEAGRALSSFRITAGEGRGLADVLKTFGGADNIKDIARKISDLDTPQKVSKFLMDTRKATTGDMLVEAWINGLLSGPSTHVVNTISNTVTALWNIPETAVAAGIGKLRGGAAGERVMFGEAGEELFAIVQGSREGLIAATKAYRDEIVQGGQKIDLVRKAAIPSAKVNVFGREMELGGKQVRIPGRLLAASDEYFKAIGSRQALNRLAYRQASKEGLTGQAHAARVANLVENPTDAMRKYATEQAEYQTFTNPLGEFGSAIQKLQQSNKAARVVFTFVRTPINIAKYSVLDRTPLGLASKRIRDELTSKDPIVRDTAQARMALGTAVAITGVGLAAQGLVTGGGPSDPKERAALYATGWQPYSFRIGDMYYSYSRIEPLATLLGLTADMYDKADTVEGLDTAAGLVVASLAQNMASKTSLTGLTDLVQAVEDPDRYGKQYLSKLAASTIPNVSAQTARMNDPYMREARTLVDQFKVRVPGLSESVPARLDIWGQPIPNQGTAGALTGIYASRISGDPVNQELIALGVFPARPLRKIRGVELNAEQYEEYQMTAGRLAKMQLDAAVAQPGWKQLPAFARTEVVENTIRQSRQMAAGYMQMKHPELIREALRARLSQINGER